MPDIFSEPTSTPPTEAQAKQPETTLTSEQPSQPQASHGIGFFTTYCPNPKNMSFQGQDADEHIVLFLRRDFATNIPWIFTTIVLLFIPPLVLFIFQAVQFSLFAFPLNFMVVFLTFYYILVVGFAFANFVSWFYNIGLVTNKRAVDIDFVDLSRIDVATSIFPDIKDAEFSQTGFFQSFFDYGDVRMRIEAATETFVFEKVPRPAQVANIISDQLGGGN
jgi:hypothetical protein